MRFWPGDWHHLNESRATRKDIRTVLSNVDNIATSKL